MEQQKQLMKFWIMLEIHSHTIKQHGIDTTYKMLDYASNTLTYIQAILNYGRNTL